MEELRLAELILVELPGAKYDISGRNLDVVDRLMQRFGHHSNGGGPTKSARLDTFLAIAKVASKLVDDVFCPDEDWAHAVQMAQVWRTLLLELQ